MSDIIPQTNNNKISGVYSITNIVNGHRYIGSSVNIPKRWGVHRRELFKSKHHSQYLQRAWNKYGEFVFKFEILEICSVSTILEREQFYIDNLQPKYNVSFSAICPMLNRKHSDETKVKMSKSGLGKSHGLGRKVSDVGRQNMSNAHKGLVDGNKNPMYGKPGNKNQLNNIKVKRLSSAGVFIDQFNSLYEAERSTKVLAESISRCCKGTQKKAGGFVWQYAERGK